MKYSNSKEIKKRIKKAKRILLNVHRSPDPDGVGSALALYEFLLKLKKEVKVICPSDLSSECLFLPNSKVIEKVNFEKFDFSNWDIFIVADSANWEMVTGRKGIKKPDIEIIVIDHHITSERFGNINLVDEKASSTSEIIYSLLKDWRVNITQSISQNLLAGIICDTGVFEYPNVTSFTLEVAKNLIDNGANKDEIVTNVYRNYSFNQLKLWGEVLKRMEFNKENRFVYSAIPNEIYKQFKEPDTAKETAASMFGPVVKGADFGMVMIEEEPNKLSVSFRSKKDFDVSKIAKDLGGGGHILAAGVTIRNEEFNKAVDKVLTAAIKYAQKENKF